MKKFIFMFVAASLIIGSTLALAKETQCYTHAKKWHACPIQPSEL